MIVARVRRTIRERQLIEPGMRVLAACSGGPDSAALLLVLARLSSELDFELEAASADHGLREGAAADVELARAQALAAGVAFHPLRVHVERASSSSLQAAARTARYAALAELATRLGAQRVAVGHTQDDQAETVLMRMLRGAGIAGLASVEPLRRDGVIRPLIDCRRAAVAAFAAEHCVQVARDPSNVDLRFERVRVRAQLMPLLEREDPAVVPHLANLADDARAVTEALQEQARALLQASLQAGESIDVSRWTSAQPAVRTWALRLWLAQVTGAEPGRDHLVAVDRARGAPAEVWLPSGWVLRSRGDGRLLLSRAPGQK